LDERAAKPLRFPGGRTRRKAMKVQDSHRARRPFKISLKPS
jgi:hypothetical protein